MILESTYKVLKGIKEIEISHIVFKSNFAPVREYINNICLVQPKQFSKFAI